MRIVGLSLIICFLAGTAVAEVAPRTLIFEGALKDPKGTPISGIFWMKFSLHQHESDRKELWSEQTYVAVDQGRYVVELGKERRFPTRLELVGVWLKVAVDNTTVVTERVRPAWIFSPGEHMGEITKPQCDTCSRALGAANADKLSGLTLKQVTAVIARAIRPGRTRRTTSVAGKSDGKVFQLECPPGHVMTGIQGSADDTIRSIKLICRPLEVR